MWLNHFEYFSSSSSFGSVLFFSEFQCNQYIKFIFIWSNKKKISVTEQKNKVKSDQCLRLFSSRRQTPLLVRRNASVRQKVQRGLSAKRTPSSFNIKITDHSCHHYSRSTQRRKSTCLERILVWMKWQIGRWARDAGTKQPDWAKIWIRATIRK